MAKFDGKYFRGLVGNLVQRKTKDGLVIQMAPVRVKQSKGTKKAQKVFGQSRTLAGTLRKQLLQVIRENYDPGMINRFNTPVEDVLKQCIDKQTGTYTFQENSFERLSGFEFNIKSLLINSLLVKPEMSLSGSTLTVRLPEIQIAEALKFPGQTNICTLQITLSVIALHAGKKLLPQTRSVEIRSDQGSLPPQDFEFEVAAGGCLCTVGIGLVYYKQTDNIQTIHNSKEFNPANICGAIITPGAFVEPPPHTNGNTTQGSIWRSLDKLNLPAEE